MTLTFKNRLGTIILYGSGDHLFNICAIEGLEPPAKVRHLQSYVSEDGCIESSSQYNQRIITISADTKCDNNIPSQLKKAARILCEKGTLLIDNGEDKKVINVDAATLTIGKRYNNYLTFVIQLTCDFPHFSDPEPTTTALFKKINYLNKDAKFPLVLTERISDGNVENLGDVKLYPLIRITKTVDSLGENTITITNHTTGKSLIFNKEMVLGEVIDIDIENRKVTSNVVGNVLKTLDRYHSLSDMWCDVGINDISVVVGGSNRGISVQFIYTNKYTEAI